MPSRLVYLYCLLRGVRRPSLAGVPRGVPTAKPPRLLDAGEGLWIVAADVSASTFDSAEIEARLDDLKWVSRCAGEHEAVVEHFSADRAIIPMKLLTIFQSDQRAIEGVIGMRAAIDRAFARLDGAAEWGVRLMRAARLASASVSKTEVQRSHEAATATTGTSFLQQKRAAREASLAAIAQSRARAAAVFAELSGLAREARRRDEQSLAASPDVSLDAAFLVSRTDTRRFKAAFARLAADAAGDAQRLDLSGPWPPYHFVDEAPPAEQTRSGRAARKIPRRSARA